MSVITKTFVLSKEQVVVIVPMMILLFFSFILPQPLLSPHKERISVHAFTPLLNTVGELGYIVVMLLSSRSHGSENPRAGNPLWEYVQRDHSQRVLSIRSFSHKTESYVVLQEPLKMLSSLRVAHWRW